MITKITLSAQGRLVNWRAFVLQNAICRFGSRADWCRYLKKAKLPPLALLCPLPAEALPSSLNSQPALKVNITLRGIQLLASPTCSQVYTACLEVLT